MNWKRLTDKILFANPWHAYKKIEFETPSGHRGEYYYIQTPGSVYVVAQGEDRKFIMINSYRFLCDKMSIEFPGGAIHAGQSPREAAQAEFREEVGYIATEWEQIGAFRPCNGLLEETCYVFFARGLTRVPHEREVTEEMETVFYSHEEIDRLVREQKIFDGQTLATWGMCVSRHARTY